MNRRTFVSSIAAASALAATSSKRVFAQNGQAKLTVGLIGCGWYGNVILEALRKRAAIEVVSLCDVNRQHLAETVATVKAYQPQAPQDYADYREMLDASSHDIVIIGTPDHWHALPAIAAIQSGADLILEKPISVDVIEGEAILAAAQKYERIVQVNTQRRNAPISLEAKEKYIDSGKLGKISLVECYFYGGGNWKTIPSQNPPAHLDYEFWAGPAPKVDYIPQIENKGWRSFMEYGNGYTGDMGVHIFDMARMMIDVDWPAAISAHGGKYVHKESTPNRADTQHARFHYPDLDISWEHRMWGKSPIPRRHWTDNWGAKFIGTAGTLNVTSLEYKFSPDGVNWTEGRHLYSSTNDLDNVDFKANSSLPPEKDMQARHIDDFLQARQNRTQPAANIEQAHISSACCILANLSMDLGRTLSYDPQSQTIPGDPEATSQLARSYRQPWKHPTPENV